MGTPYMSELRIMSFGFAPKGWALCNGQFMPINQNQALFSLLGTTYGGDGRVTFALPNLQGRVPIGMGPGYALGQTGGESSHTLTRNEMPAHAHTINAKNASADENVGGRTPSPSVVLAEGIAALPNQQTASVNIYGTGGPNRVLALATVTNAGGSQPHENRQPYLVLNVCIALQGVFPSPH